MAFASLCGRSQSSESFLKQYGLPCPNGSLPSCISVWVGSVFWPGSYLPLTFPCWDLVGCWPAELSIRFGGVIYGLKLPIFDAKHKNFGSHEIFSHFCDGWKYLSLYRNVLFRLPAGILKQSGTRLSILMDASHFARRRNTASR